MRRVAAHEVIDGDKVLRQAVVEIQGDQVKKCYEFSGELARTEWLGGTITVEFGKAYHKGKLLTE